MDCQRTLLSSAYENNGRNGITSFNGVSLTNEMGIADKLKYYTVREGRPYYLCISRVYPGSESLLKQFDKELEEMKKDGSYQEIHDRYR